MCKNPLHGLLQRLPKCEHHIHLEGALRPDVQFRLARKHGIDLPATDPAFTSPEALSQRYNLFTSLDDFLHYYYLGMTVLLEASDFETLAWDYFKRAAADGVVHAEVFFDPQAHLSRGVLLDAVLLGFSAARLRAEHELGVTSELICCFLRHLPLPHSLATFDHEGLRASFERGHIIGIGLDSSEAAYPPELFTELFQLAKALGLKRTAHAGEEGPPEFIKSSLDKLCVERIDHGVRLAEDGSLLKRVAEEQILLSICPISNVYLQCISSVSELPLRTFLESGVRFSINSDDPAYFGGHYILDNFCAVQDAFNLSIAEWNTICKSSIYGSWCNKERKERMLEQLSTVIDQWTAMEKSKH